MKTGSLGGWEASNPGISVYKVWLDKGGSSLSSQLRPRWVFSRNAFSMASQRGGARQAVMLSVKSHDRRPECWLSGERLGPVCLARVPLPRWWPGFCARETLEQELLPNNIHAKNGCSLVKRIVFVCFKFLSLIWTRMFPWILVKSIL